MTDRDHIEALKQAADPDRLASEIGLGKGRGGRFFCPACQPDGGKSPDLVIKGGGFICHKCRMKGDILKLVMTAGGMDFMGAVRKLEDLTGIRPPPSRKGGSKDTGRGKIVRPGAAVKAVSTSRKAITPDPAIYAAFLEGCRPVEGAALDWLAGSLGADPGAAAALAGQLGLRFCGREYKAVMAALGERFGDAALLAAGLLKLSKKGRPVPSFWHYFAKSVGFLVIPYFQDGRPVYLKARPPAEKDQAESLGLVPKMNIAAAIPCLYNVDALKAKPDRVVICEGESDTWAALAAGWAAVGAPGAKHFRPEWVGLFRDCIGGDGRSTVFLGFDMDEAGAGGSRLVADLFVKAGLPVPRKLTIPEGKGKDLREYLKTASRHDGMAE